MIVNHIAPDRYRYGPPTDTILSKTTIRIRKERATRFIALYHPGFV
jgi:hypothetical protein